MGKPIVAGAVGEVVDYLDGGHAGLLVAPDDPSAFALGVISLLRDPALASELGRRAKERVWQNYDWARQVIRVEAAYGRAIGGAL
jgi:glycosyltransferase involved in cell wall biosynthesis